MSLPKPAATSSRASCIRSPSRMASQATRSKVAHGPLGGFGLFMVAPDRSTDAMRATGWVLGGGRPRDQLPAARAVSPNGAPSTGAGESAGLCHAPAHGSLLSPIGHALLGQRLAQPGMVVVHVLPRVGRCGCAPLAWPARRGRAGSGLKVEAGLPIPKARRSSSPEPRSAKPVEGEPGLGHGCLLSIDERAGVIG
jgi:hypothetical protein